MLGGHYFLLYVGCWLFCGLWPINSINMLVAHVKGQYLGFIHDRGQYLTETASICWTANVRGQYFCSLLLICHLLQYMAFGKETLAYLVVLSTTLVLMFSLCLCYDGNSSSCLVRNAFFSSCFTCFLIPYLFFIQFRFSLGVVFRNFKAKRYFILIVCWDLLYLLRVKLFDTPHPLTHLDTSIKLKASEMLI